MYICIYYLTKQFKTNNMKNEILTIIKENIDLKDNQIKTEFNLVWDFLKQQQEEDKLTTNQLHLIIQTLATFLDDDQFMEVENLFNIFKK